MSPMVRDRAVIKISRGSGARAFLKIDHDWRFFFEFRLELILHAKARKKEDAKLVVMRDAAG